MKIKQLFEERSRVYPIVISYTFKSKKEIHISEPERERYTQVLEKETGLKIDMIEDKYQNLYVKLYCPYDYFDDSIKQEIAQKLINAKDKVPELSDHISEVYTCAVMCYSELLDKVKYIKFLRVFISCTTLITSEVYLKDINKKIECERLKIQGVQYVKGNVLGILKIKGLKEFENGLLDPNVKWFDIVSKYVKDKDILSCHEELVDNGLEDYAQL